MSEIKRSKTVDETKQDATCVLNLFKTLRRLELADYPSGIYFSPREVFSVWSFAKTNGDNEDESKDK